MRLELAWNGKQFVSPIDVLYYLLVNGFAVYVILASKLAVRHLDLFLGGTFAELQHLIGITLVGCGGMSGHGIGAI